MTRVHVQVAAVVLFVAATQVSCASARPAPFLEKPGAIVATVQPLRAGIEVRVAGPSSALARTNGCGVAVFEGLEDGVYSVKAAEDGSEASERGVAVTRGHDTLIELDVKAAIREPDVVATKPPPPGVVCTAPTRLSGPDPRYTADAFARGIQGCLVLECVVDRAGTVRDCRAIEPLPGMTEPTIAALEQRRYTPMTCGGESVDVDYVYRISFRLPR